MARHEFKAIDKAISLIAIDKHNNADKEACLDGAALRLQFVMDCGTSSEARQLAATIAESFDLMPRIEILRKEAAA